MLLRKVDNIFLLSLESAYPKILPSAITALMTTSLSALYVYLLCVAQEETSPKLASGLGAGGWNQFRRHQTKPALLSLFYYSLFYGRTHKIFIAISGHSFSERIPKYISIFFYWGGGSELLSYHIITIYFTLVYSVYSIENAIIKLAFLFGVFFTWRVLIFMEIWSTSDNTWFH